MTAAHLGDFDDMFMRPRISARAETEWDSGLTLDIINNLLHPAWHKQANCRGRTSDMFPSRTGDVVTAKRICEGCPVIDPCKEAGYGEEFGVWGGTSGKTREAKRVADRKAAKAA